MDESLPPGFRFHPTDEELITYYLTRKVSEFGFVSRAITDVDLNKCEPWDLPGKAKFSPYIYTYFRILICVFIQFRNQIINIYVHNVF